MIHQAHRMEGRFVDRPRRSAMQGSDFGAMRATFTAQAIWRRDGAYENGRPGSAIRKNVCIGEGISYDRKVCWRLRYMLGHLIMIMCIPNARWKPVLE